MLDTRRIACTGLIMETVTQRGIRDCGVAVVATLACISYEAAFAAFEALGLDPMAGSVTSDLRRVLRPLGVELGHRSYQITGQDLARLMDDAVLSTRLDNAGWWHWMVWDYQEQRILDPGKQQYKQPPAGWYLKVKRLAA